MDENFEKNNPDYIPEDKPARKKKSKNDMIIKTLTIACIVCAIALVGVIVTALVNSGNDTVTPGNVTPDVITSSTTLPIITNNVITAQPTSETTAPSTTAAAQRLVYATEEVNVRSGPSTDSEILTKLPAGGSAVYISLDSEGWCKVIYDSEVCYIHRDYLTTTPPAVTTPPANTTRKTINPEQQRWYLVVVDKTRQIPEGYEPQVEYVADSDCMLDTRVVPYYDAMYNAALEDGIELVAYSGFRSYETQETNYNSLVEDYMYYSDMTQEEAEAEAATEILPPGCSEHNLGLAMDIDGTDPEFAYTEEYEWLSEHAHEYGFIERYTEEKQNITGIIPEPWHWRFVGPDHAAKIKAAGVTLEEYLQYYNVEY